MSRKLLEGVKVLELASFIAAPSCAKILADWGALVIKVESLSGDGQRYIGTTFDCPANECENPWFEEENFNKKSISVDLKSKDGQEILHKLMEGADVFVTNLRTPALERLGLAYQQLKSEYPQLIMGQIMGYGEKGPLKDKPGFDYTAYFARGGIMASLMEKDTSPINGGPGFGDHYAGISLAGGVCAALYNRKESGLGEKVTVSLYHTALYGMGSLIISDQYGNKMPLSRLKPNSPVLNSYKCKDDRWIQLALVKYDLWIGKFFACIDRKDLIEDQRFNSQVAMADHVEELVEIISQAMILKGIDEWEQILLEADVPFERIQTCEDIQKDQQAWANQYLIKKVYDTGTEGVLVNTPVQFKEMGDLDYNPAPRLGEDTDTVLKSIGYGTDEIEDLKLKKAIKSADNK